LGSDQRKQNTTATETAGTKAEQTLVQFVTDHGISHARGKQFLYDEGTHVPFVVRGPGISAGVVSDDLIEHIDMAVYGC
jgi:arylsulfatase A-like enzyme